MEVPRLGVQSELQLWAYTTAVALPDSSMYATYTTAHGNAGSFNPLSKARDWTHILMDTGQILNPLSHNRNSQDKILYLQVIETKSGMLMQKGGRAVTYCQGTEIPHGLWSTRELETRLLSRYTLVSCVSCCLCHYFILFSLYISVLPFLHFHGKIHQ